MVDKAAAMAEQRNPGGPHVQQEDRPSGPDTYARKLAENMNQGFAIDARSSLCDDRADTNFPVGKKEKQNRARDSNMEEWRYIQGLLDTRYAVPACGGIGADDPAAISSQKKLDGLERSQLIMKSHFPITASAVAGRLCAAVAGPD